MTRQSLSLNNQLQHTANRIARTANQLTYARMLLDVGQEIPKELADEIAVAVGDASYRLTTQSAF